jgi:hypothetical protein
MGSAINDVNTPQFPGPSAQYCPPDRIIHVGLRIAITRDREDGKEHKTTYASRQDTKLKYDNLKERTGATPKTRQLEATLEV